MGSIELKLKSHLKAAGLVNLVSWNNKHFNRTYILFARSR